MDAFNITNLNNSSSLLSGFEKRLLQYYATLNHEIPITVMLPICFLGIPGNMLMILIYIRGMTTSTRVYMFALAVVDLNTCICGIVITMAQIEIASLLVFYFVGDLSLVFSILLLAFVAIERLLAVRHPHKFNFNAMRAKKALVVLAVITVISTTVLEVARLMNYVTIARIIPIAITVPWVLVMIVCYILMGAILLKKARSAHTQVAVLYTTPSQVQVSSVASNSVNIIVSSGEVATTTSSTRRSSSAPCSHSATAQHIKNYKSVSLLFTITAVFIACWLPIWLHYAGVYVPKDLRSMFVLNSAVNPFIYSVVSAMFRNDVKIVCRKIRSKLTTCYL